MLQRGWKACNMEACVASCRNRHVPVGIFNQTWNVRPVLKWTAKMKQEHGDRVCLHIVAELFSQERYSMERP